jgi:hypothetical protein
MRSPRTPLADDQPTPAVICEIEQHCHRSWSTTLRHHVTDVQCCVLHVMLLAVPCPHCSRCVQAAAREQAPNSSSSKGSSCGPEGTS